jgi:pimeloyl-ACP methyl ester carboxylesterase
LKAWTAEELAKIPTYYVMDLKETMAQTVAHEMPSPEQIAACAWLPDAELDVYVQEFRRTGFQGGLQWYRCAVHPGFSAELALFSGLTIDIPAVFISGASDWNNYQRPGALEAMQTRACTRMLGCHFVEDAGHWVQQEQPEAVVALLCNFLEASVDRMAKVRV